MKFTYPKTEKLKSRKLIGSLFSEGKSVSEYPLRLVYMPVSREQNLQTFQLSVSVSKKYFKKAVDRNYYKRLLRETYRHNQHQLKTVIGSESYIFMLLYQSKERLDFEQVNDKTIKLFEKFVVRIHPETLTE